MKRTIQIGDKYKDMLEKYELELDKEEFSMLITKLLKTNQELQDKNIDIFLVCELINKYNLDFFSLINIFSSYSINILNLHNNTNKNIDTTIQETNKNINNLKDSPLLDFNKSSKNKKSLSSNTNNHVILDNNEEKNIKNENIKNNKEISKQVKISNDIENKNDNPILSLGIDLS